MRKYTIWDEMKRMQKEMDNLFTNFFMYNKNDYLLDSPKTGNIIESSDFRQPLYNIKDNKDNYLLSLEIPGSKKEDINISINGDQLEVKVENKHENKNEIGYYSYFSSFTLPSDANKEDVDAEYKNGVLNITLRKNKTANRRLIEIK